MVVWNSYETEGKKAKVFLKNDKCYKENKPRDCDRK